MSQGSPAGFGADLIHRAFDDHRLRFRALTRRVQERFENRDWVGIRQDTVERVNLHPASITATVGSLRQRFGERLSDRSLWADMKDAYTLEILGRDDFELAQTFFNSLTRRVFSNVGVDPAIHYLAADVPMPYHGWEMASARMYAAHRPEPAVIRKILLDAGFRVLFADLDGDSRRVAERLEEGLRQAVGGGEIEAFDILRPIFFRNKGAYVVGRARRGEAVMPLVFAILNEAEGLVVDAVLPTEDETSIVFSFARWYFHADVPSPREVIGFLQSILPRKRITELYISLGHNKHGKTEFYRDVIGHIARSDERFKVARGVPGLIMTVFTLPSYEFVFKVIKDSFPPAKGTTRERVMEKYRQVLLHDRVGRLVDFQEFEHLTFPRSRFVPELLEELLDVASETVSLSGEEVVIQHMYVERRVTPLDVYLREASPEEAEAAVLDWGQALKDLAAADIFTGDILLKNFGVTRHGRVVSYDYDELAPLAACRFRHLPEPRDADEELAAEPWFSVADEDVFPEELRTFLDLRGHLRELFLCEHGELLGVEFWQRMQERNRSGEIIDFYPYAESRRLSRKRAVGAIPEVR